MLAMINMSPEMGICRRDSPIQSSAQRRTSFLIRDILGKQEENVSDTDDGEMEISSNRSSSTYKLNVESSRKERILSSPLRPHFSSSPSHTDSINSEDHPNPNMLSPHRPTTCCRECNINSNQRPPRLSPLVSKKYLNATSLAHKSIPDTDESKHDVRFFLENSSTLLNQDNLERSGMTSDDSKHVDGVRGAEKRYRRAFSPAQQFQEKQEEFASQRETNFSRSPDSASEDSYLKAQSMLNHRDGKKENLLERLSLHKFNQLYDSSVLYPQCQTNSLYEDSIGRLCPSQEQLQQDLLNKMKEPSILNHAMYSGLFVNNTGAQNLIDLNYLYSLRAAALALPQIPTPLTCYNSTSDVVTSNTELLNSRPFDLSERFYSRHRLLGNLERIHPNLLTQTTRSSMPARSDKNDKTACSQVDLYHREERNSSTVSPSPTFSEHSTSSPSPEKRPLQLPAYLRSRLGGAASCESPNGDNGSMKKCRRSRTVFTELQMLGLEKRFEKQQYLSTPDRVELAELLGLSQLQVKTWYQNRRMKWKKQVMQAGGTEPPTKQKGRPRKIRPGEQNICKPSLDITSAEDDEKVLNLSSSYE